MNIPPLSLRRELQPESTLPESPQPSYMREKMRTAMFLALSFCAGAGVTYGIKEHSASAQKATDEAKIVQILDTELALCQSMFMVHSDDPATLEMLLVHCNEYILALGGADNAGPIKTLGLYRKKLLASQLPESPLKKKVQQRFADFRENIQNALKFSATAQFPQTAAAQTSPLQSEDE